MKRTEAIKKIAELFEEHSNNQQYKGYSHEGLAETFLDIAEHLGMLPPMQEIPAYQFLAANEWDEE
jgi:hypothetical protein